MKHMEKKQAQNPGIVKCPFCNTEYHIAELAVPGELLGRPKKNGVIKDPLGKILYLDWEDAPETVLQYNCDNCERDFNVEVTIIAKAKVKSEETDFSTDTVSLL